MASHHDDRFTANEIIFSLECAIDRDHHGRQNAWAKANGFSAQYVCDVLKGRREISEKMARALGFRREVSFLRSGGAR